MAEPRTSLISSVTYLDPRAALAWLSAALGFETVMLIEDDAGAVVHAEMRFGGGSIMVGGEWSETHQSPQSLGGRTTQAIHLHVAEDIDAHCERARAVGAEIVMEPADQFYGDRVYRCRDPEGHVWVVGQTVRTVTREEAEAASGLKITGWI